jgi:hypothetical protein
LNYDSTPAQLGALFGALAVGAAALALGRPNLTPAQRVLRSLVLGGCVLIAGVATWNFIVRELAESWPRRLERGSFRTARLSHHWPMYGRYAGTELSKALPVVGLALLALWRFVDGYRRGRLLTCPALLEFALLSAALTCACAYSEGRFAEEVHFRSFRHDLTRYASAGELLRTYVADMPLLHTFSRHYPPGFLLAFWLERRFDVTGVVAALSIALTCLTVVPLRGILRELRAPPRVAWSAVALSIASAGVLIYPTLAPTPATLLPAVAAVWLFLRGLRTGSALDAVGLGVVMSVHIFFSFAVVLVVLYLTILAAAAVIVGAAFWRRVAAQVGVALMTFALILLALRWATGFDIVRCFLVGAHEVTRSMGSAFDSWDRYLLRGTGSILAYLLSAGLPLAVLGMTPKSRANYPGSALVKPTVLAAPLAMLLAVTLGLGHLETERIWLFFTPTLAIAAAFEHHRRAGEDVWLFATIASLALLWAVAQELQYRHY